MQFLQCSIPEMILKQIAELVQPFSPQEVTAGDIKEALLQYKKPMMTVAEFAKQANCSKRTVYRAIQRGDIQFEKVGNSYRIYRDQFTAYADKLAKEYADEQS